MLPIVLKDVCKYYENTIALKNISTEFEQDKTTVVIGPSGSGKSTLIQLINGLLRPESGEVFVFQKTINYKNLPALRTRIGYAVQGTGLFPHLDVKANITLLAKLQNWPDDKIAHRLEYLMDLVNLPVDYKSKYPFQLSGGEQQRVGLCRAMMLNPKIFLLDEPFGALDPITRAEIHQEFIKLQKSEARTILLVTHDLREAIKLADKIVVMNLGEIEQIGTPREIVSAPVNDFVLKFVKLQLDDELHK